MDGRNRFLLQCPATVNVKMLFISPLLSLSPLLIWWREPHSSAINSIGDVTNTHTTLESFRHCPTKTHIHTHTGSSWHLCVTPIGRTSRDPSFFILHNLQEENAKKATRNDAAREVEQVSPPVGFFVCYHFDTVSYTAAYNTENKSSSSYTYGNAEERWSHKPPVFQKKKGEIESNVNSSSSNKKMKIQLNWTNRKKEEEEMARVKLNWK